MISIDAQFSNVLFELGRNLPQWVVVFLATYLIWIMAMSALIILKPFSKRFLREALVLIIAIALAYAINFIIGYFFFRDRPFASLGFDPLIHVSYPAKSFPSDHAAIAWTAAWHVFLRYKKSARLFLGMALLISLGRVLAGVHYAGDVFAGAIVGIISAILARAAAKKMLMR